MSRAGHSGPATEADSRTLAPGAASTEAVPFEGRAGDGADATAGPGDAQAKASSHVPLVAALLYSVARFSKKFACSTAFSMSSSQGSGLRAT